jgi:hypothetical protein
MELLLKICVGTAMFSFEEIFKVPVMTNPQPFGMYIYFCFMIGLSRQCIFSLNIPFGLDMKAGHKIGANMTSGLTACSESYTTAQRTLV